MLNLKTLFERFCDKFANQKSNIYMVTELYRYFCKFAWDRSWEEVGRVGRGCTSGVVTGFARRGVMQTPEPPQNVKDDRKNGEPKSLGRRKVWVFIAKNLENLGFC